MIEVKELVKKYGNHTAVDNLSFCIEKGQIYGFLGPNGAGKSTTMNMITGYLAPTQGSVVVNGYDIVKQPEEAKKSIGYLPELPPLYTEMTVYEYLKFVAELKKIAKAERKQQIEEIMALTMITEMKDRLIKNLSKGYKQRVGLAQAIMGYPEVIILDEPTVGLDPKQIMEMRDLIKSLKEKHTVILSSHILSEVSAVCDFIMIIANGKLVASDTPQGLQEKMEGKAELQLTICGEKEDVVRILEALDKIESMKIQDAKEEGCVEVVMITKEQEDIRKELFYLLAQEKLPIMHLQYQEKTLEDIFLEVTQVEELSESQEPEQLAEISEQDENIEVEENEKEEEIHDGNL